MAVEQKRPLRFKTLPKRTFLVPRNRQSSQTQESGLQKGGFPASALFPLLGLTPSDREMASASNPLSGVQILLIL